MDSMVRKKFFAEFSQLYRNAVADVLSFMDREKLELIAKHNPSWAPDVFDQELYLLASETRYRNAIALYSGSCGDNPSNSMLDVGGFFGAFPLTMARLGMQVSLAEKYSYYADAFSDLTGYLQSNGVRILDLDFTEKIDFHEEFGIVTNLAMLEHLAGSPKILLNNLVDSVESDGRLILEVPNIAFWPKRFNFLKGITVHPPIRDVYYSADPFVGHHREYTREDLLEVIGLSGLECLELISFNYTPWPEGNWKQKLLLEFPSNTFESCKEILMAVCRKRH